VLTKRLTVEEGVIFHANPTTPAGQPASLDGPLTVNVLSGTPHDPVFCRAIPLFHRFAGRGQAPHDPSPRRDGRASRAVKRA
jgi:hypothetical protein